MCACTHVCMAARSRSVLTEIKAVWTLHHVCMYVRMCACTHVCMAARSRSVLTEIKAVWTLHHVCMYVYMYVCMYVYTHVCMAARSRSVLADIKAVWTLYAHLKAPSLSSSPSIPFCSHILHLLTHYNRSIHQYILQTHSYAHLKAPPLFLQLHSFL
jgi:hypothetical protein